MGCFLTVKELKGSNLKLGRQWGGEGREALSGFSVWVGQSCALRLEGNVNRSTGFCGHGSDNWEVS